VAGSTASAPSSFDPDLPARLHPQAAVRAESFGALVYHYGTRRLVFVKSPQLASVLSDLDRYRSARDAVEAHVGAGEVTAHLAALSRLHEAGVLHAG